MNKDHKDSIKAYALAFGDHPECANTESAILTGLDGEGFLLEVTLKNGARLENVKVPYQGDVTCGKDLHTAAIGLHRMAYDKLGYVFKVKSGYYGQVVKMIGFQAYKKARGRPGTIGVVSVATIAAIVGVVSSRRASN